MKNISKESVIAELKKLGYGDEKSANLIEKHIDVYEVNYDEKDSTAKSIAEDINEQETQEAKNGASIGSVNKQEALESIIEENLFTQPFMVELVGEEPEYDFDHDTRPDTDDARNPIMKEQILVDVKASTGAISEIDKKYDFYAKAIKGWAKKYDADYYFDSILTTDDSITFVFDSPMQEDMWQPELYMGSEEEIAAKGKKIEADVIIVGDKVKILDPKAPLKRGTVIGFWGEGKGKHAEVSLDGETAMILLSHLRKENEFDYAKLAKLNVFDLFPEDIRTIEEEGSFESGHWVLSKINDNEYEAVRDGLYMEVFKNLKDLITRENKIADYEYDEAKSEENGEETFVDSKGKERLYKAANGKKLEEIIGYNALIKFNDANEDDDPEEVFIKVGSFDEESATQEEIEEDESVFFYLDSPEEIENLKKVGVEDFIVVSAEPVYDKKAANGKSVEYTKADKSHIEDVKQRLVDGEIEIDGKVLTASQTKSYVNKNKDKIISLGRAGYNPFDTISMIKEANTGGDKLRVINAVISQMNNDVNDNNLDGIAELITFAPKENLIGYLATDEAQTLSDEKLKNKVIDQIVESLNEQDHEAIEEFLQFIPTKNLKGYLTEGLYGDGGRIKLKLGDGKEYYFKNSTVKQQVQRASNWMGLGTHIYVIDYTNFSKGKETEKEAENNAFTYWNTKSGIEFQDERSRIAYLNNTPVLSQDTGGIFNNGGGIGKEYKLRAEGLNDFINFIGTGIYFDIKWFKVETTSGPDVIVTFSTDLSLKQIKSNLEQVEDSHVMLDTVKPVNEYTGERFDNGGNVGRDAMFRSQEPHEQRYDRKREWKEYKKDNWLANDWFDNGGAINESELDILNNIGFKIKWMKDYLNRNFVDSFGFTLRKAKPGTQAGQLQPDYDKFESINDDNLVLTFPTKREHAMCYQVTQGNENTNFLFV